MKRAFFIYYFRYFSFFIFAATAIVTGATINSHIAAASGFGVSPSSLEFVVEKGSEASRQLIIYSTGDATEFNAVSSNPEMIMVYPSAGIISEKGTERLTVTAFGKKAGVANEHITISFQNSQIKGNEEVALSLGTYVAARLSVVEMAAKSANAFVGFHVSLGIVAAGLSIYSSIRSSLRQPLRV